MATTLTDIQTKIQTVEDALATAKRRKKATKAFREQLEALVAEAEAIAAEQAKADAEKAEKVSRPVGRPHKYIPEYYEFIKRYARAGRGRPARAQVEADLVSLGVEYDEDAPTRVLEVQRRVAYQAGLEKVTVLAK